MDFKLASFRPNKIDVYAEYNFYYSQKKACQNNTIK